MSVSTSFLGSPNARTSVVEYLFIYFYCCHFLHALHLQTRRGFPFMDVVILITCDKSWLCVRLCVCVFGGDDIFQCIKDAEGPVLQTVIIWNNNKLENKLFGSRTPCFECYSCHFNFCVRTSGVLEVRETQSTVCDVDMEISWILIRLCWYF